MFCKNCGKEFSNDTNFCPACGKAVDDKWVGACFPKSESEWKKWVVIACSMFSAVGMFLPILIANTFWWEGFDINFSLFDFWGFFNKESNIYSMFASFWEDDNMGIFVILPIVAVVTAAATTLIGFFLLFDIKERTSSILATGSVLAKFGIIYPIVTMILTFIENEKALVALDGDVSDFFEITIWGWLLLIVAIINLCICMSGTKCTEYNTELVNKQ